MNPKTNKMPKWVIEEYGYKMRNQTIISYQCAASEYLILTLNTLDLEIFGLRGFSRNIHRVGNARYAPVEVTI